MEWPSCNGKVSYWMGAAMNTIYIDFPSASCVRGGSRSPGYIFSDFNYTGAGAPKASILSARVQVQSTLQKLNGYKYPDTWCDKAMTHCKAPF